MTKYSLEQELEIIGTMRKKQTPKVKKKLALQHRRLKARQKRLMARLDRTIQELSRKGPAPMNKFRGMAPENKMR